MNTTRRCAPTWRPVFLVAAIFTFLLPNRFLQAQTNSIPDRLPADTVFYLYWNGKNIASGPQEKNHVLQLLTDPDFAPLRDAMGKSLQSGAAKDGKAPALDFTAALSLMENPGVFGVVLRPAPREADEVGSTSPNAGAFAVYDATGKTALIEKWKALQQAKDKDAKPVTTYTYAGTSIEVRTTASGANYSAHAGKYYLYSDKKHLIEDLIRRFSSAGSPVKSVTELPEYQAIRSFMGADSTAEFFGRMPDLDKVVPEDKQATTGYLFARNLHLEKFHVVGGGVSFTGEATRFRGAILGDASTPSIFDITGESGNSFATLPIVNQGPLFSIFHYDLPAIYRLIRAAALEALPPDKSANIAVGEGMAQAFLGMTVDDALHLFTGEVAYKTVFAEDGNWSNMYAITIQKPQDVLHILRAALTNKIVAEDTMGDTTFLDISYPTTDPTSGQQKRNFYYVAVAPQLLFAAPRKAMVRDAIARLKSSTGGTSTEDPLASAELNRMRKFFPEKLSGMSAADMSNLPWDKIFLRITEQVNEAAKGSKEPPAQSTDWLKLLKPEVFSRHLHAAMSAWWKDSNGIYFDSYLQ